MKPPTTKSSAVPRLRVAIYTRQSVDRSTDSEFGSLQAQREAIEAYVRSQAANGWVALPDRYDDAGFSGSNTDRPAFQRLLEDVKNGKVDAIAVYKIDRLSRSLLDFAEVMRLFEDHGVTFVSVTQQFNSTTPMGALTLNILMSFAQFEREVISERTRDKIRAMRQNGIWCGGHPILGYDAKDGKLVTNSAEAATVNELFGLYLKLGSISAVVDEVNRRGWRNKSWTTKKGRVMRGLPFDRNAVNRILRSPLYNGYVPHGKEVFKGQHEAIVAENVWKAVQHQMTNNRTRAGADLRNKHAAVLRGLLFCARCGKRMFNDFTSKGERTYHYYTCPSLNAPGEDRCHGFRVRADDIEKFVIDRIRELVRDPRVVAETIVAVRAEQEKRLPDLTVEVKKITVRKRQIEDERRNLIRAISISPTAADTLTIQLGRLDEEFGKLEARDAELRNEIVAIETYDVNTTDVRKALEHFDPVWDQLILRERTRLLSLLIERITFDAAAGEVQIKFRSGGIKVLASEGVA